VPIGVVKDRRATTRPNVASTDAIEPPLDR
jgi:hypothetical protein